MDNNFLGFLWFLMLAGAFLWFYDLMESIPLQTRYLREGCEIRYGSRVLFKDGRSGRVVDHKGKIVTILFESAYRDAPDQILEMDQVDFWFSLRRFNGRRVFIPKDLKIP